MARWTAQLPAPTFLNFGGNLLVSFEPDPRPQIDAALAPAGLARFLVAMGLYRSSSVSRAGWCDLSAADSLTQSEGDQGEDLSDAFETGGSLTLEYGGNTLTWVSPDNPAAVFSDPIEVYEWWPRCRHHVLRRGL